MQKTYRQRILEFWDWFPAQAPSIDAALRSKDPHEAMAIFVAEVRERISGLAWVFGRGEEDGRRSFTVTGEGQAVRQLLAQFWLENATPVTHWDFYNAKQPAAVDSLNNMVIEVADQRVDFNTVQIQTTADLDQHQVDLVIWHPVFQRLEEEDRFKIVFLLLDELLGELGTQNRLGKIDIEPNEGPMPLLELRDFLDQTWKENDWDDPEPSARFTGYGFEDPTDNFLRSDTVAGFTCTPHVVFEYLEKGGPLDDDPLEGTGASLMFVELTQAGLDHLDSPIDYRNGIEELVTAYLAGGGGYLTGAATGVNHAYLDLILFDGENSLAAVRDAVSKGHEGTYEIHPFAK